jgi:HAD superfamily hydrolase (TIGR01509 family)
MTTGWAAVFDVDGTLVDSERDGHRVAFNVAFAAADLPYRWDEVTYGDLLQITGGRRRLAAYLERQGVPAGESEKLAGRLHRVKTEVFVEMVGAGEIEPRPGVWELLRDLERAGARLAVATTGSPDWVHSLLARRFGDVDFEVVVTRRESPVLKPEPDAYRVALEQLGLPGGPAVAVEDSQNGLVAARRAGMPCVIVANPYTAGQLFERAALVLDDFRTLDAATLRGLAERRWSRGRPAAPRAPRREKRTVRMPVVMMRAGADLGEVDGDLTIVDQGPGMPAHGIALLARGDTLAGIGILEKGSRVARLRCRYRVSAVERIEPPLPLGRLLAAMPDRFGRHVDYRLLPDRTATELLKALHGLRPELTTARAHASPPVAAARGDTYC